MREHCFIVPETLVSQFLWTLVPRPSETRQNILGRAEGKIFNLEGSGRFGRAQEWKIF
jgi:hypothetical protein